MTRVRFVEPARLEALAEVGYYHRVEAGLGAKSLEAFEDATARAPAYSLAGSPAQNRTRRTFLRDFPFALVYCSDEQGITIYALAHHAHRLGYWRSAQMIDRLHQDTEDVCGDCLLCQGYVLHLILSSAAQCRLRVEVV